MASPVCGPARDHAPGAHRPGPPPIDVEPLRSRFARSGFRNVYATPRGTTWRARVKYGDRLRDVAGGSRYDTPLDAARAVAWWYHGRYGPHWATAVFGGGRDRRRRNCWSIQYSRGDRGYVVTVWEQGKAVVLGPHIHPTDPSKDKPFRRAWTWPTAPDARRWLDYWRTEPLRRRWGERARDVLWR